MIFPPSLDLSGTIARLFIHPVKSCAGLEVSEALLTPAGLALDRAFMVVDAQGVFLTQRGHARMALVRPQLTTARELVLTAPGRQALHVPLDRVVGREGCEAPARVSVWDDAVPAWDTGEPAAQWFSGFLGLPCRLVRFDPAYRRLSSLRWTGGIEAPNRFSDGFPLLVTSQASVDGLNERLLAGGEAAVGVERFRANIVIDGVEAHDEDRIDSLHIGTPEGAVQLQLVKPCVRCPIPDIDPATAESSPAVSGALRRYRQDKRLGGAISFGMNAIVREGAGRMLRVGQPIAANLCFD